MNFIAPIVEGHGEQLSIERLLWRIAEATAPGSQLRVNPPIRVKAGSFLNNMHERNRHVHLAASKAREHRGCVLVLLDSEDNCPAQLGPKLQAEISGVVNDVPVVVTLAYREFETWFIAAVRSLRGVEGIPVGALPPSNPAAHRDAKRWIGSLMSSGYDPVVHQLALTQRFDLEEARSVDSFDRLYRKIGGILSGS